MRPVPQPKHLIAVLIFAAVAAASGYLAILDQHLSDEQVHIATAALKRHSPELFTGDGVYDSELWKFQTPALQGLLEFTLVPTGYQDPTLPFRLLAGIATMVYLCGMYALLYRQCRSWSVAAFVAVLSMAVIETPGGASWGVGSLASMTPMGLVVAVTPLIVLSFLRYIDQVRILLVFAFVGLCGNIDLIAAMNLTIVLVIAYLGYHRLRWRKILLAVAGLGCAVLLSLPYIAYFAGLRWALTPETDIAASIGLLRMTDLRELLYPGLLESAMNWLPMAAVLFVPSVTVLTRMERFRARDLQFWIWLAGAAAVVTFGFQMVSQAIGAMRGTLPPILEFAKASIFIMLPLYVLFAQALTDLFRLIRRQRVWVRWACVLLLAVWMIPAENFRYARHRIYFLATMFMEPHDKPLRVQELNRQNEKRAELLRIAEWVENPRNTPVDSLVILDDIEFRMRSRRAILASGRDLRFYFYMTPWRLEQWHELVRRTATALRPRAGAKASGWELKRLADELASQERYEPISRWYTVLRVKEAPVTAGPIGEIQPQGWGEYYRLYRVR